MPFRIWSSRKISPASIVFPMPTPSAIRSLGMSDRTSFMTGLNW